MSEDESAAQQQGKFNIHRIYIKDCSFEAPNSPAVFNETWDAKNNLELNTNAQKVADNIYEVVIAVTVTVKNNDKTAFLVEIHQAGLFELEGFDDQNTQSILGSFCPGVLFPYVREAVSDLVTRGGFPQLLLAPINFDALYQQHLQQQQQAKSEQETAAH
jgi:preprotein translocase subunit SecB